MERYRVIIGELQAVTSCRLNDFINVAQSADCAQTVRSDALSSSLTIKYPGLKQGSENGWLEIQRQGWQAAMKCCSSPLLCFNFSLYRINRCGLLRLGQNSSKVILLLQITAVCYNVTSILSPAYVTLWAKNITCNVTEPVTKCKEWHIKVHAITTNINSTLIIHTGLHTMIRRAILLLFMSASIYT